MDLVLTIIAPPGRSKISDGIVARVRGALNHLGAETAPADWLAPEKACDIAFSGLAAQQAVAAARSAIDEKGPKAIDVIAGEANGRRKKMLVADMDSTIVTAETLDELADFAGLKDKIAKITQRAMQGKMGFEEAVKARVSMLSGLGEDALEKTMKRVKLTSGAKTLVQTMKANGAHTILVSGGFSYFTDKVRDDVGFDKSYGNRLGIKNGELTGEVMEPILDKDTKLKVLLESAAKKKLSLSDTISIGDGANDVPMLGAAGIGIAFRAHPIAADAASGRLDHADLTGVLYAQGYRIEEFVLPN
ncbi:MAG: phosphoserine phosphatase SerB [Rhodospirillaceae bacterium]|nr:phosphoserine phosphatase SerB [Rhodospirillaceae bacterium]